MRLNRPRRLRTALCLGVALAAMSSNADAQLMHGYLGAPNEAPSKEHGGGFSMYVAAWPLLEEWPGSRFQTGLFGTWMFAQKPDREIEGRIYSDIEGGLGWWRDTRFATATPKFIMGGVTLNFATWANGPGAGKGRDWTKPQGKYGVAQLSPWVVWPPDGLNLAQGTCGELFGYGYLPLPLVEPKDTTAGHPVPTGGQCWTLFLNAENFKGPVAFFTPYFFSQHTIDRPDLAGIFLDAAPADPARQVQMETQYVPAVLGEGRRDRAYARITPTRFPANGDDASVLVHRITSYRREALWDGVQEWFAGGDPVTVPINPGTGSVHRFNGRGWSTWKIHGPDTPKEEQRKVHWEAFATPMALDEETFGYRFDENLVRAPGKKGPPLFTFPDHFELDPNSGEKEPKWSTIAARRLPSAARHKLSRAEFTTRAPHRPEPYVTPTDGCWAEPGPVAGPFQAELGDGSVITYSWYRFADQPALQNADLADEEREEIQRRVELLHRHWSLEREYLPAPGRGSLASLDPAVIVTPPKGYEIGYVPICTRQEAGKELR